MGGRCLHIWFVRLRHDQHTFCAFVDTRKAFDTSWVEATLVRLHQAGVTGGMWRTIANFLCGTLSQVRARGEVSSLGLTLALRRDGCSRHFCSTSWSKALQRPYDALRQVSGSCPLEFSFHVSAPRRRPCDPR